MGALPPGYKHAGQRRHLQCAFYQGGRVIGHVAGHDVRTTGRIGFLGSSRSPRSGDGVNAFTLAVRPSTGKEMAGTQTLMIDHSGSIRTESAAAENLGQYVAATFIAQHVVASPRP